MSKRKPKADASNKLFYGQQSTPKGIILERFKRLNSLPSRPLDLVSEFFIHHYLKNKRYLL